MIIEFRSVEGAVVSRYNLGGNDLECAAATQQQYEQRMVNLGAPVELAKRAAARHMRGLANPRITRASSLQERIAAANAAVAADIQAGRLLDTDLKARIAAANKLVNG